MLTIRTINHTRKVSPAICSTQKRHISANALVAGYCIAGSIATTILICSSMYKVADANQYIVRTGLGIKDIAIDKKCVVWPFQKYKFINMHPENYEFELSALSIEKIPFRLPGFFTIGPKDDKESLIMYVRLLSDQDIHKMILGVLEGETRILSSKMTLEEIFNNREVFKKTIIKGVQEELDQFGLIIYNANIKEMKDSEESKYFHNMMQKKESETENMAKVDVAEANKRGTIGEKEREAGTRQQIAIYEAETIRKENNNQQEIINSNAELAITEAKANQLATIAQVESKANSSIREYELEQDVQNKKANAEYAGCKARVFIPKMVEADVVKLMADANLYAREKEAAGMRALYNAQSDGLNKLSLSLGGNHTALMQFLMLDKNQYELLAKANAEAFQGLNPKITMFNTGPSNSDSNPIADIFKMLPMGLMYLNDQLGLKNGESKDQTPEAMKNKALMIIPNKSNE